LSAIAIAALFAAKEGGRLLSKMSSSAENVVFQCNEEEKWWVHSPDNFWLIHIFGAEILS
jgi:hypothetical protein